MTSRAFKNINLRSKQHRRDFSTTKGIINILKKFSNTELFIIEAPDKKLMNEV